MYTNFSIPKKNINKSKVYNKTRKKIFINVIRVVSTRELAEKKFCEILLKIRRTEIYQWFVYKIINNLRTLQKKKVIILIGLIENQNMLSILLSQ